MMTVAKITTLIIGNGLDIAIDMRTRYVDFYKSLKDVKTTNTSEIQFLHKIRDYLDDMDGLEFWTDLEVALCGDFSLEFRTINQYLDAYRYAVKLLNEYLRKEFDEIDWTQTMSDNTAVVEFLDSLLNFTDRLADDVIKNALRKQLPPYEREHNIVVLNYTDVIKSLLKIQAVDTARLNAIINVLHLHGKIDEYITVGAGTFDKDIANKFPEDEQIKKIVNKSEYRNIVSRRAKPGSNDNPHNYDDLAACLKKSDIVAIYGTSLGSSDKTLWAYVLKWFISDKSHKLIIFVYDNELRLGNGQPTIFDDPVKVIEELAELDKNDARKQKLKKEYEDKIFAYADEMNINGCVDGQCLNENKENECNGHGFPCKAKRKHYFIDFDATLFNFKVKRK